jgi:hypothetical protein
MAAASAIAYAHGTPEGSGLIVIPVTGRPPDGVSSGRAMAGRWRGGRNGAFYFRYDDGINRMTRCYAKTAAEGPDRPGSTS